jgi:hypothetical protein
MAKKKYTPNNKPYKPFTKEDVINTGRAADANAKGHWIDLMNKPAAQDRVFGPGSATDFGAPTDANGYTAHDRASRDANWAQTAWESGAARADATRWAERARPRLGYDPRLTPAQNTAKNAARGAALRSLAGKGKAAKQAGMAKFDASSKGKGK